MTDKDSQIYGKNVLGRELKSCGTVLSTGFYKDGYCRTDRFDTGTHAVCAQMTKEFLTFAKSQGEDLINPNPTLDFPGLTTGDRWCVCASRWSDAYKNGVAPPVFLDSTHESTLRYAPLEALLKHHTDIPKNI